MFYVCVNAGWPSWAAFVAAVVVGAPLLGLAMDRFLYRFIRSAPVLVKLVSALGMLIAIPAALDLIFGSQQRLAPPSLWLPPGTVYFHVAGDAINGTELSTVIVTLAVVLLLSLMSHFTQIGLRMRAMAESPRMVQLAGVNSELVGIAIWVLSSFLAGLAGVLLAPLFADLQVLNFTDLLVAAIATAAFGSLTSLPLAFWGGIGLGVVQELLGGYLPSGSVLSSGLRPALPFAVLLALLLLLPGLARTLVPHRPLRGLRPAATTHGHDHRGLRARARPAGGGVGCGGGVLCFVSDLGAGELDVHAHPGRRLLGHLLVHRAADGDERPDLPLPGGVRRHRRLHVRAASPPTSGISVLVGMLAGGAVAAAVGVVVALPALSLAGLALALATLAFGLLAENIGFQFSWSRNGDSGVNIALSSVAQLHQRSCSPCSPCSCSESVQRS